MHDSGLLAAYTRQLDDLLTRSEFRNAPRGFQSREVLGRSFVLRDPLRRVIALPARKSNIVFNFAEALWYFAGRGDLDYLAHYAPGVARFVSGAAELTGTAYGRRIFHYGVAGIDQWESVARTLADDPDSKRAVVQIFRPEELLVPQNPDVACTLALQFLIREDRLHAVAYMRANDAYRGLVSDVFSFTFLQELMARQLGLQLGSFTHMVGSLHLYDPDVPAARRVVGGAAGRAACDDRMPAMPDGDPRADVARVMEYEQGLRQGTLRLELPAIEAGGLPEYWLQVVVLLELYRRHRLQEPFGSALPARLAPLYREMFLNRFPDPDRAATLSEVLS